MCGVASFKTVCLFVFGLYLMLTLSTIYYLSREWIADALLAVAHVWGSGSWLTVCQTDMLLLVCDSSLWPATSAASLNLDGASGLSPNLLSHDLPSARTRELSKVKPRQRTIFFLSQKYEEHMMAVWKAECRVYISWADGVPLILLSRDKETRQDEALHPAPGCHRDCPHWW